MSGLKMSTSDGQLRLRFGDREEERDGLTICRGGIVDIHAEGSCDRG